MDKSKLIESAKALGPMSQDGLKEFDEKMDGILVKMNESMKGRKDIIDLVGGKKNLAMMKDNHSNHLRFIRSIVEAPDAETLVDTVLWVFRAYMSRDFHTNYWSAQLNTWVKVMEKDFSKSTMKEIAPIYNWMIINIPHFTIASEDALEKSAHTMHDFDE